MQSEAVPLGHEASLDASGRDGDVARGLTDLLYRNLPLGLLGTVVIAALLGFGLHGQVRTADIAAWYLACGVYLALNTHGVAAASPWVMGVPFGVGQSLLALVLWRNLERRSLGLAEELR